MLMLMCALVEQMGDMMKLLECTESGWMCTESEKMQEYDDTLCVY